MKKVSSDISPGTRKMNETPASRGPPSPARRLNRSKSVFSLAQDFFKMALNTSPDEPMPGPQDNYAKPGSWNLFGSLRGTWNGASPGANSQRSVRHNAPQSLKPLDTRHVEDAPSSLLRHRKSLHNLFGTVGKRSSMKGRTDQTVQSNVLRKRSGAGNNLQVPDTPSVQSIEDADRVHPPKTYAAGSHGTIGHRKGILKVETEEPVPRPDSGVGFGAIHAPRRDYQGITWDPRVLDNKQREVASLQPPKVPIELVCLSKKPSLDINASGYTAPLPPAYSNSHPAARPLVSQSESGLAGPYPGTISQSLRRIKENLDFDGPDYNKLLAGTCMPTKIDIDPFFTSRAQSLEQRYKDLSTQPQHQRASNTEHDPQRILESIDQNAERMSKNLNISENRCSQSGSCCHPNATAPPDSMPRDSWINAGFLGHECGMFTQNDKVDEADAFLGEKIVLGATPKKDEITPSRENVICGERPNTSPGSSLRETLSASPLLVPKRKKPLQPRKKRRAMRSTTRNISMGPFHINFPKTEFGEAHHETYQSKSDAIGSLFQNVVEYSDYILFDRGSSTFYPQPKGYVSKPLEEQSRHSRLECIWLPMQFGRSKAMSLSQELSLNRCAGNSCGGDHPLSDIRECGGDTPASSTIQSEEPQSITRTSSNNSLLDLYFGTSEGEHQRTEAGKLKQPEATPAMALPIRLRKPLGEPASPQKLGHLWDEVDDGVITEPLDLDCSVGKTKTWADLGIEFLDKYAPDKNADGQKRAVDAARNFLRVHGKFTSDYDSATRPQRKTWSRDRDGSEDISFLHIEDLARYETLRAEYRRHMALFESSSGSGSTDALAEANYTPRTREVSRVSSRDSGYADIDAMLTEPYLGSREKSTTGEAVAASPQSSSSTAVEEFEALKATNKITDSPCHSPAPSMGEEHAQPPAIQSTRAMGGGTPPRIVRTCSFGNFEFDFELENPFNTQVGSGNIAGNIDTEGLKTPQRAPLQGGRSNFIQQGKMIQNQPATQAEAPYDGPTNEPLQKRGRDEEDEKENEERNWRDFMLYG